MARVKRKVPFDLSHGDTIYKPSEIGRVLSMAVTSDMLSKKRNGAYYYNVACAFDIETSSFYIDRLDGVIDYNERARRLEADPNYDPERAACMYCWQFGINGFVIMGRTWDEFETMLQVIADELQLDPEKRRLAVYVHNLSYEFQWICRRLEWKEVFATDWRKVLSCVTDLGIEFKCSLELSGYSLSVLGNELRTYKVQKLTGALDYSILRHSGTPLTPEEIDYCRNDVLVVMAYIQEKMEAEKNITKLALTKTGEVRRYVRQQCLRMPGGYRNKHYVKRISELTLGSPEEYQLLKMAFQGGFTHANAKYSGLLLENVHSFDFTSSYPAVMVTEKFPMTRGTTVKIESAKDFEMFAHSKKYLSVFTVVFEDLVCIDSNEAYISESKCFHGVGIVPNNGRVVAAKHVCMTLTNIDMQIIEQMYTWKSRRVDTMVVYQAKHLPKEFVKSLLTLYDDKTVLKGVQGKEAQYAVSKGMLNSCYGMCVTDIVRDDYNFTRADGWTCQAADIAAELKKYNEDTGRFLFYAWGVFVTAYARRNLFSGILEFGDDYVYSDTDSVKVLNVEQHLEYIRRYNAEMVAKLEAAAKFYGLPLEMFVPRNQAGALCPLGVWDDEGNYERFKTLGAKRYMVQKANALYADGERYDISLTVSGVNKKTAIPYLVEQYGNTEDIFNAFDDHFEFEEGASGKLTHTYIDIETKGTFKDYLGNEGSFHELSSVHLEPTTYMLGIGEAYKMYLEGVRPDVPAWERKEQS